MNKIFLCIIAVTAANLQAQTEGIRYLDYHPDRIPNIVTAAGIASEIIFEEDEEIAYYTFGFDAAWDSAVALEHILVFKAKDEQPQTNLLVHTNKRHYVFTITSGNDDWEKDPNRSAANYSLRIRYHDSKSMAAVKAKEQSQELRHRDIAPPSTYIYTRYDYRATAHAQDIIPQRMWDNGVLTFINFAPTSKRGVVYELQADGKTALVNQHTEKNGLLIVHGVYAHLIIRLGDEAVEIRRNHQGGRKENRTKTTVPHTVRSIAGDAPHQFNFNSEAKKEQLERAQIFSESQTPAAENATEGFE